VRRMFWLGVGASVGILLVRRIDRFVDRHSPQGLARRAGHLGGWWTVFVQDVRAGMAEREAELRIRLGLEPGNGAP
jgi:hypothetical protein